MTLESGALPQASVRTTLRGETLIVSENARTSFEYILKLLERGLTFTYSDHLEQGLVLEVEMGRRELNQPTSYVFPGLARSHDANVNAIAAQAIAAVIRMR